jgi:undecaprenyl-diphosphatase
MDWQLAHGIGGLDQAVTRFAVELRTPFLDRIALALTELGSWRVTLLVVIALSLAAARRGARAVAFIPVVSWAATGTLVSVLKAVVQRHRPDQSLWLEQVSGWSFPSHDAALAACAFGLLREQLENRAALWGALVVPVLVAATRVYLGVHNASDATVGLLVGWTISWAAARAAASPRRSTPA